MGENVLALGGNAAMGSRPSTTCLVCGGRYRASRLPGLKECDHCGFITADVSLSDTELEGLYGKDYFHGVEYRDYVAEGASLKFNFRRRIETLKTLIPAFSSLDVFEIGCAYGFFLDDIRAEVRTAKGIDISEAATNYARANNHVDAACGNYLDYRLESKPGLVAMWDTIEHLARPDLFLEKVSCDLAPGGYFAVTTGDIGSLNARVRGRRWRMIHPPTHLHYFSADTLTKLLAKNGFELVHLSHPGNARDLRSILHFIVALRMGWDKLYDRISSWRIFRTSVTLNLFDIMFIVARKRDALRPETEGA